MNRFSRATAEEAAKRRFFTEDNPAKGKPAPFFFNLLYGVEENKPLVCEANSKPIRHTLNMTEASRGDVRKPANQLPTICQPFAIPLLTFWFFYTDFPRPFFSKNKKSRRRKDDRHSPL